MVFSAGTGSNTFSPPGSQISSNSRMFRPFGRLLDQLPGLRRISPPGNLDPFARLQVLVMLEEVPDLLESNLRQVGVVHDVNIALRQLGGRNRDDLLVTAAIVLHFQHADG